MTARNKTTVLIQERVFADYCSRKFPSLKVLAEHHGVSVNTLKRSMARNNWATRRQELESQVFKAGAVDGLAEVVSEVKAGVRPAADAHAARRIAKRQQTSDELDDILSDEVEHTIKRLPETRTMALPTRLGILETAARIKHAVLGSPQKAGEHERSVAILIGFVPGERVQVTASSASA